MSNAALKSEMTITLTEEQQKLLDTQGQLSVYFHNTFSQKDYDEGQTGTSTYPNGDIISWNKGGIKVGQVIKRDFVEEPKQTPKEKLRCVFIKYLDDNAEKFGSFTQLFNSLSDGQKNDVIDGIIDALTYSVSELTLLTMAKTLGRERT